MSEARQGARIGRPSGVNAVLMRLPLDTLAELFDLPDGARIEGAWFDPARWTFWLRIAHPDAPHTEKGAEPLAVYPELVVQQVRDDEGRIIGRRLGVGDLVRSIDATFKLVETSVVDG